MANANQLNEIVEVAELANLLVNIATGAGVPIIGLVSTIAANYAKGSDITPEDIAGAVAKAKAANNSLGRAIANKKI